jgi:hypothetical protein
MIASQVASSTRCEINKGKRKKAAAFVKRIVAPYAELPVAPH